MSKTPSWIEVESYKQPHTCCEYAFREGAASATHRLSELEDDLTVERERLAVAVEALDVIALRFHAQAVTPKYWENVPGANLPHVLAGIVTRSREALQKIEGKE